MFILNLVESDGKVCFNNLILLGVTIFFTYPSAQANGIAHRTKQARISGVIGDPADDMPYYEGAIVNLFHNDSIGNTDKHNSNAAYFGFLKLDSQSSYKLNLSWRFFTTNTRKRYPAEDTLSKPGRFADTISLDSSYQYMLSTNLGVGVEGGISHIADHGAKEIQLLIHQMIGAHTHSLHYRNQPNGFYGNGGTNVTYYYEAFQLWEFNHHSWQQLGIKHNAFISEIWLLNSISSQKEENQDLVVIASFKSSYQVATEIFAKDELLPWHHEISFGAQIWKYWTPQFKWISGFLNNDRQPQAYLDVFNINYPF